MRQFFLFISLYFFSLSFYFFLFIFSTFSFSPFFSSSFSFSPFNPYLCILTIYYSLPTSFPPIRNHKKRDWKPNTLKMSVNTIKDLSSPFFRCCYGWGADGGHGGCSPTAWRRHYRRWKSTMPLGTAVPSRAWHAGGGVELFKLDCRDDLWVSSCCSDGLWFSSAPFRCVCCGGGIICTRIDGLQ